MLTTILFGELCLVLPSVAMLLLEACRRLAAAAARFQCRGCLEGIAALALLTAKRVRVPTFLSLKEVQIVAVATPTLG